MEQRINEDIRFYLPADPYYYEVDNLPLEDLLSNDVRLQSQIDSINSAETGNTVGRAGFTELQPYINPALAGTVSVRPGNFIGRTQRSSSSELGGGAADTNQGFDGLQEMKDPPTTFGSGENPTGTYAVFNPGSPYNSTVGRTSVFSFRGGSISIDKFNFDGFEDWLPPAGMDPNSTAPQGRIDLIGITTMNGAIDDPWIPGNSEAPGVLTGDGVPRLAVVKGAGIVIGSDNRRQVVVGERYVTVGASQESLNDYGRNLEGDVVPNPEFGTVPSPDDVVNVNFARDIIANGEIAQTLSDWADSNKNANFFLPVAYVYVPQSHVEGNPIPEQYLKDIRPFFRTAELALPERQAIAASLSPSVNNPFTTVSHAKEINGPVTEGLQDSINDVISALQNTRVRKIYKVPPSRITNINNIRTGPFGWRKVSLGNMPNIPQDPAFPISRVCVFFFGFQAFQGVTYVHTRSTDPLGGFADNITEQRVLCSQSYGWAGADNGGTGNTVWVPVDSDGSFWFQVTGKSFNTGLYADLVAYDTNQPIMAGGGTGGFGDNS